MEENKKEIVQTIVYTDTGECIDIYDGDRVKIIRENQIGAIKKSIQTKELNEDIKDWNKELGGFIFFLFKYCNDILQEHPEVTSEDITKLFYLATYVNYRGYLISEKKYVTKQILIRLLNLCPKSGNKFLNKMINLNILAMDFDNKYVMLNKDYFVKGNIDKEITSNNDYTRVYIKTIQYLFKNVPQRKHKQLGMYFKMIPFIHRQQNALSWNPNSKAEDINLMTLQQLKDVLGYSRNGLRAFKNELFDTKLYNGESIIGIFQTDKDDGKSTIIVNPMVFYGGNFKLSDEDETKNGRYALTKTFHVVNNKY